jgi:FolB domain-containing protein
MDRIYIRDLKRRCIIGVFPRERTRRQTVLVNVCLECRFGRASVTDRLEDTVDYKSLNKRIIRLVESSRFKLIETLAGRIAGLCLADRRVRRVTVTVDKPGALRFTRSVAVEVTRARRR